MAAKISVSLPEALKTALDSYATEHQLSVSQVVQNALEALLQGGTPTPPPPPPDGMEKKLQDLTLQLAHTQHYVSLLNDHLEQQRECMALMTTLVDSNGILPIPAPMPDPPW